MIVEHPTDVIDENAIVEFTTGGCGYLAVVLHDLTGWQLVAEYEKSPDANSIAHIWVVNSEGRAVDINGVHDGFWARTKYSDPTPGRIAPISRDKANGDDTSFIAWAQDLAKSNLDHFGLVDLVSVPSGNVLSPR